MLHREQLYQSSFYHVMFYRVSTKTFACHEIKYVVILARHWKETLRPLYVNLILSIVCEAKFKMHETLLYIVTLLRHSDDAGSSTLGGVQDQGK